MADGCSFNTDICCIAQGSAQTAQLCAVLCIARKDYFIVAMFSFSPRHIQMAKVKSQIYSFFTEAY